MHVEVVYLLQNYTPALFFPKEWLKALFLQETQEDESPSLNMISETPMVAGLEGSAIVQYIPCYHF